MTRVLLLASVIALLVASRANGHVTEFVDHSHEPGVTYTAVGLARGQVRVLYTVPRADLERLAGSNDAEQLSTFVAERFVLLNVGKPCETSAVEAVEYEAILAWQFELDFDCKEPLDFLRLHYKLFQSDADHRNYTEVMLGSHVLQLVLGRDTPFVDIAVAHLAWERGESWALPDDLPSFPGANPGLSGYFTEGFSHVLTGYDHLAFVLGLVVVLMSFVQLAWTITAFTLAHSVTLGISAADFFVPSPELIEPLIAASIVYIGVENLFHLRRRYHGSDRSIAIAFRRRWPAALVFGLAHGFGFSYMLRELGLPEGEFLVSLAMFNVGVEAGQLAVVALPFVGLYVIRDRRKVYLPVAIAASVSISAIGGFWLGQRLGLFAA